jgi:hypothetical protein
MYKRKLQFYAFQNFKNNPMEIDGHWLKKVFSFIKMWMRPSRVVRASDSRDGKVETVLGWISASSDTMGSEGRQMKQSRNVWKPVVRLKK